jgi:hypothetical protein
VLGILLMGGKHEVLLVGVLFSTVLALIFGVGVLLVLDSTTTVLVSLLELEAS